jgi:hypothetical protein
MPQVTIQQAAEYLARYTFAFREEYESLVGQSEGAYPPLEISPFLYTQMLTCVLALDGYIILEQSREPTGNWWTNGGPVFCIDYAQSREPADISERLKRIQEAGHPTGVYHWHKPKPPAAPVWHGRLPAVDDEYELAVDGLRLVCHRVRVSRAEYLNRLTFGTYGTFWPLKLLGEESPFWMPTKIHWTGFSNAERTSYRFINYLESGPHLTDAAWDPRNIHVRTKNDVRRDYFFASVPQTTTYRAGFYWQEGPWEHPLYDRLSSISRAIAGFELLLENNPKGEEAAFHDYIKKNPLILDLYAEAISKPRFNFPYGASPLGKSYVEPDFILRFPDRRYKLVELERPSKDVATSAGHPRSEFTQASFQIAEWRNFLSHHYHLIKDRFPGLESNAPGLVIISRSTQEAFGGFREIEKYKSLLQNHLANVEFLTYDDLLQRAKIAYARIASFAA